MDSPIERSAQQIVNRQRLIFSVVAVVILVYFFWGAGRGLWAYFTHDDLMNLYYYWSRPVSSLIKANLLFFSPYFRPMGGAFYRPLFAIAGYHPLPFRVACFALLIVNLYLLFCFARRLTSSNEVAALATLIGAYHPRFANLYYNTGTCYDLLCFFFYLSALLYYTRAREQGAPLRLRQLLVVLILYVWGLNSKEMAVTFPLVLAAYELVYHPPAAWGWKALWQWLVRQGRTSMIAAALAVPFLWGKMHSPDSPLAGHPAYTPQVSYSGFVRGWTSYLDLLFLSKWFELPPLNLKLIGLLLGLLILAWLLRSRAMQFCWLFVLVTILPVVFITVRAGFVLYLPMAGWAVYAAILLVKLRDALVEAVPLAFAGSTKAWNGWASREAQGLVQPRQVGLFILTLVLLVLLYGDERYRGEPWTLESQEVIRSMTTQLARSHPTMPLRASILFLDDPFVGRDFDTKFLLTLYYRDPEMNVDLVRRMGNKPDAATLATYDFVFAYQDGRLIEVSRGHAPPQSASGQIVFDPASEKAPVHVRFTPEKVRPGIDAYTVEIPGLASTTVDLLCSFRGGAPVAAEHFCWLDSNGRARIPVPWDTPTGVVRVVGVRRSGRNLWLAAAGSIEVIR